MKKEEYKEKKKNLAERNRVKYQLIGTDEEGNIDPRNSFTPLKEQTGKFHEIARGKKYFAIMSKMDKHRYFMYRVKINDIDNQLWICGDTIIGNPYPDAPVSIRCHCVKTKKWCCGWEGSISYEFFAVCPHCKHVFVAIDKNKEVPCDYCKKDVDCNGLLHIRYNCENCPAEIGLDAANLNLDYAYNNQHIRSGHDRLNVKNDKEK